jgi:hypothetical protein
VRVANVFVKFRSRDDSDISPSKGYSSEDFESKVPKIASKQEPESPEPAPSSREKIKPEGLVGILARASRLHAKRDHQPTEPGFVPYWVAPVLRFGEQVRAARGGYRPLRLCSGCTGMWSEGAAAEAGMCAGLVCALPDLIVHYAWRLD